MGVANDSKPALPPIPWATFGLGSLDVFILVATGPLGTVVKGLWGGGGNTVKMDT